MSFRKILTRRWAWGIKWRQSAVTAINDAQALLDLINFNGNTHANMTTAQKNQANSLAMTLDQYNNNTLC